MFSDQQRPLEPVLQICWRHSDTFHLQWCIIFLTLSAECPRLTTSDLPTIPKSEPVWTSCLQPAWPDLSQANKQNCHSPVERPTYWPTGKQGWPAANDRESLRTTGSRVWGRQEVEWHHHSFSGQNKKPAQTVCWSGLQVFYEGLDRVILCLIPILVLISVNLMSVSLSYFICCSLFCRGTRFHTFTFSLFLFH